MVLRHEHEAVPAVFAGRLRRLAASAERDRAANTEAGRRPVVANAEAKGYGLGYGQFLYSLTRNAHDLQAMSYFGKGAVLCLQPRSISVWSMGPQ